MSFDSTQQPATQHRVAQQETPPKVRIVAWIALAAAVLGFMFACIPGALIVSWILLPVAFVLSIVGLAMKGKKWPAIVALILSVVGTVVAVIVVIVGAANAVVDAIEESGDVTVSESAQDEGNGAEELASEEGESDASAQGARDNPLAIGETVSSNKWSVTVNSVTLGATDQVMAESPINEEPEQGSEYILVNVTTTYIGDESGLPAVGALIEYVTADGVTINGYDSLVLPPDALDATSELYTDASVSGNLAFAVPSDTAANGTIAVQPGMFADKVFFSAK